MLFFYIQNTINLKQNLFACTCIYDSPDVVNGQLKSLFPKPDISTFGENLVFNIIVHRITLELVTEWNLDPDNSSKYNLKKSKTCFPI